MNRYNEKEKRTLTLYIFIFILLAVGISISGYLSYRNFEGQFREQVGRQLSSIAELKMNQLVDWRKTRMADANMLYQNHAFAALVQAYFENPNNLEAESQIQDWLKNYQENSEYSHIRLMDAKGQTHLSFPIGLQSVSSDVADHIPEVLQSKKTTLFDFYRTDTNQQIRLSLLVPIMDVQTGQQVIGLVAISIDPQIYLYPFIEQWPIDSTTAETLLIRREGNDAVFVNNLRFDPNAALTLRFPLTDTKLPSVKAVLGQTGIVQGLDYHGKQVLADVRAVPNSPWFLVSKMDIAEVDAPLTTRSSQTFGLVIMAIFMAGAGLMTSWRQQRVEFYRAQVDMAEAVRESEIRLKEAQVIAGLGSYALDFSSGTWTSSDVLDSIFGIDEKFERSIAGWSDLIHPDDRQQMNEYLTNEVIEKNMRFDKEYRIVRKNDGVERWVYGLGKLEFDAQNQLIRMLGTIQDITERKQAEEALRESEEKWHSLVNTTPDYIALHDQEGRFQFLNHYAEGYSEKDVVGNNVYEYILPESVELFRSSFEKAMNGGATQHIEHKAFGDRGAVKTYEDYLVPVHSNDQNINVMVVSRDITERKRMEEELQASELRFRSAAENLTDVIYEWDLKDTVDWYGDIDRMMGYPNGKFPRTMSGWTDSLHPNDRTAILAAVDAQLKHAIPYIVEYRIRKMDDSWRWWSARGTVLRDEQGQPTRWVGSVTDITERKRVMDALQRSERKYRQLHESMMDGFVSVDMDGKFLECNEVYRNMLGYTEAELTHLNYIELTPEKWHAYEMDVVQNQIMKRGYSDIYEKEYRRKDGSIFPVELHTVLSRDEYGKPSNMWAIVRDITERKRAEQQLADYALHLEEVVNERTSELREAQEQLVRQEKLATLGQLAGSMGHELRNPLGVISNAIYFLRMAQPDASDQIKEYLTIIEKETRTSDKIITDLLDFARLKSVERETVSVFDMIQQTLNRFPVPAFVDVTLNIPSDLPLIFADPHHVVQILSNLTVNAYQAVESNGGQVEITAAFKNDMVSIAVHDNGMGISSKNIKKIFEPLFTTKIKGIGLGLAVSKKLAEANGGRIEVESETGVGSTFTVWLPVH